MQATGVVEPLRTADFDTWRCCGDLIFINKAAQLISLDSGKITFPMLRLLLSEIEIIDTDRNRQLLHAQHPDKINQKLKYRSESAAVACTSWRFWALFARNRWRTVYRNPKKPHRYELRPTSFCIPRRLFRPAAS